MRLISVDMITPDMTLAFPVYCKDVLVINAGKSNIARFTPNFINMGIRYVYVEDELSEGIEIPDAISSRTRRECNHVLQNTLKDYMETSDVKLYNLSNSIEIIIEEILANKDVQVSLNAIGTVDEQTYLHSVNVCVYSLLIGRGLNFPKKKLEELAMGAILHDIGKTLIEPSIQFKQGRLTTEEFERIKKHTEIGYYILSKSQNLPEASKQIALNHHERLDGCGYPMGKSKENLHTYDCIVAIADVYDALISDRCYKKKWCAADAVNFLIKSSGTMLSPELVQIFIKQIAIYPNGSMVSLSDGTTGIIKAQNQYAPLRPIVRVIRDANANKIPLYEVDLMKILSLTITNSQLEIENQSQEEDGELEFS
ncbi:MAG: HD-GYP domain-containing protein [Velocimicrobium sp.]